MNWRYITVACMFVPGLLFAQEGRWSEMDARFNELFATWSDRPVEMEVFGRKELMEALELENCDRALVAQSLIARAGMMLNRPFAAEEDLLSLPSGCADDYPRLHYDLGYRLMQANEPQLAASRLMRATASTKWASHAWNLLGTLRSQQGDYDGAVEAWKAAQAAVMGIPNPSIYVNLGGVASHRRQWKEAVHWFNLALEAQIWNEREGAYTFLYDIRPIIHTNLLRSAVNARDTAQADMAWQRMWPIQGGSDTMLELRTMLDYALWRQRQELVPGLVELFEEQVARDTASALEALNDRAMLFSPWREVSGWSIERTADILARAEASPELSIQFPALGSSLPGISGIAQRAQRIHRLMIGTLLLSLLLAMLQWAKWGRARRERARVQLLGTEAWMDWLKSPQWRDHKGIAAEEIIRRLKAHTLDFRISSETMQALNAKELIILQMILNGTPSAQIAENMNMSLQRVYNVRSELRSKLDMEPGTPWNTLVQ